MCERYDEERDVLEKALEGTLRGKDPAVQLEALAYTMGVLIGERAASPEDAVEKIQAMEDISLTGVFIGHSRAVEARA